ncbi:MAG TPA: V-type ATP synthase subunit E [Coriobacteriia bacterium]|nr:V-type ATP synthase subunit E [Coriobacteriia bacterium]
MALEDIFRALDEQADKECEDILATARAQAAAIVADAEEQAARTCSACVERTESVMRRKAAQQVNAARLDMKKRVAAVKQESIDEVFVRAGDALAEVRSSAIYPDVFRVLAREAVDGVPGNMALMVDPADEALARAVSAELGLDVEVRSVLSTAGGAAVETGGGRIVRHNTFEDRLEKVRDSMQSDIAEILFT